MQSLIKDAAIDIQYRFAARMTRQVSLLTIPLIFSCTSGLAHAVHRPEGRTLEEQSREEAAIQRKIEASLDWRNRAPETLDQVPDQDRMLIGGINESILLRQSSGERFGLFEAVDEREHTKVLEVRLHKKNKLTDRFAAYSSQVCNQSANISADQVQAKFVVFTLTCSSTKFGTSSAPYLFDYASRNFYQLAMLDYDANDNSAPTLKLVNGLYKMRWKLHLRGEHKSVEINRSFRIRQTDIGTWNVQELPPIDSGAAGIVALLKLPIKPKYDLPSFVADW